MKPLKSKKIVNAQTIEYEACSVGSRILLDEIMCVVYSLLEDFYIQWDDENARQAFHDTMSDGLAILAEERGVITQHEVLMKTAVDGSKAEVEMIYKERSAYSQTKVRLTISNNR